MPLLNLDEYKQGLQGQRQLVPINLISAGTVAGRVYDGWRALAPQGNLPAVAEVPDINNQAALLNLNAGGGLNTGILGARFNSIAPTNLIICDRLVHSGGLDGTVTTAQTTNLPTSALTRATDGLGVMIGLTIYTAVGSTGTTVSASYTNQDGTPGRTTPLVQFGATGHREANRLIILPYQEGDLGVLSVESVTVTATTGTAGNFGVTLFKPLYVVAVTDASSVLSSAGFITGSTFGGVPIVPTDACLFPVVIVAGGNLAGSGALLVDEF